jgi:hypothetical protein
VLLLSSPSCFPRRVTLQGTDVADANPRVIIGSHLTVSSDHSYLTILLPEGVGLDNTMTVTVYQQESNGVPFTFNPPMIDTVMDLAGNPLKFGTCCRWGEPRISRHFCTLVHPCAPAHLGPDPLPLRPAQLFLHVRELQYEPVAHFRVSLLLCVVVPTLPVQHRWWVQDPH